MYVSTSLSNRQMITLDYQIVYVCLSGCVAEIAP